MRITPGLLLILLFLFSYPAYSQQGRYEIGVEGGITNDLFRVDDPSNNIKTVPCTGGTFGISFRRNFQNHLFVEAAFLLRESYFGFKFTEEHGFGFVNDDNFLTIPLRVGYGFLLTRKFSIAPIAGMALAIKTSEGGSSGSGTVTQAGTSAHYQYKTVPINDKLFLLQASLSLEYIVFRRMRLSFAPTYYHGLTLSNVYEIDYQIINPNSTTAKATMKSYGSLFNYQFGIKYMLSARKKQLNSLENSNK